MHTVRNRLASRPPASSSFPAGKPPPGTRRDAAHVPRGSMAAPLLVAEESGLIEGRAQRRRNPKGKKARKAAARLAAVRDAKALEAATHVALETPRPVKKTAKKTKAKPKTRPAAAKSRPILPEQLPAIPPAARTAPASVPLFASALAPKPALTMPIRPEPLVELEPIGAVPAAAAPEPATVAPLPLLPVPEPLAKPEHVPEPEPAALAKALTALADIPIPRARALVPARRQGLVDVIAFLLRDSGRRLARWSARRHKTRTERDALRRAEARQINLQRELEALDALRRAKG